MELFLVMKGSNPRLISPRNRTKLARGRSGPRVRKTKALLPWRESGSDPTLPIEVHLTMNVDAMLQKMVEAGASDAHFEVGSPPGFRISGAVEPQGSVALQPDHTEQIAKAILSEDQWKEFAAVGDLDCSYSLPGGRFRVNVMRQRGSISLVLRQIPTVIPSFEDLGLPPICRTLSLKPRGLVLVTGPTGSGKSTTLAAMIEHINSNQKRHIITMEDPIEFVFEDNQCVIEQREVGLDTTSFHGALRHVLRQDPDVIMVGEMRDLETISLAVTAAETGHLVFGTLHTSSAIKTVDRIVDVLSPRRAGANPDADGGRHSGNHLTNLAEESRRRSDPPPWRS